MGKLILQLYTFTTAGQVDALITQYSYHIERGCVQRRLNQGPKDLRVHAFFHMLSVDEQKS